MITGTSSSLLQEVKIAARNIPRRSKLCFFIFIIVLVTLVLGQVGIGIFFGLRHRPQ